MVLRCLLALWLACVCLWVQAGSPVSGESTPSASLSLMEQLRLLVEERDFALALRQLEALEPQVHASGTEGEHALFLAVRAQIRGDTGQYPLAETDAREALLLAKVSDQVEASVRAHNALGSVAYRQGRHESALEEYFLARRLAESAQTPQLTGAVLINIGITLRALGEPRRALDYYNEAGEALKEVHSPRLLAARSSNMSRALIDLGRSAEARSEIEAAMAGFRTIGDRGAEARSLRTLAALVAEANELALAEDLVAKAFAIDRALPSELGLAGDHLARGKVRMAQGLLPSARTDFREAILLARKLKVPTLERDAASAGADLEVKAGDFEQAYHLLRETRRLDELLRSESLGARALDIEGRYRFEAQGQTIHTLKENAALVQIQRDRSARERNLALIAATAFLLLAVLGLVFSRLHARTNVALQLAARSDPLTGVGNRRLVFEHIETRLGRGPHSAIVVMSIDVDHFKSINDRFGHAVGDRTLCLVADILRANWPAGQAVVARWGGEEFLVLLDRASIEQALASAESIRAQVAALGLEANGKDFAISVTIGIAVGTASNFEQVLANADAAMYAGKRAGRNRVVASEKNPPHDIAPRAAKDRVAPPAEPRDPT